MTDHLLPHPGITVSGFVKPGGEQYIRMDSMMLLLTTMELNNAKHPNRKPEYDEVLVYIRDCLNKINWSKP